jgi:hypothetical protein
VNDGSGFTGVARAAAAAVDAAAWSAHFARYSIACWIASPATMITPEVVHFVFKG